MNDTSLHDLSDIHELMSLIKRPLIETTPRYLKTAQSKYPDNYCIIKYDKSIMSDDLSSTYGLCRSVVVENSSGNVLSFAPPKSISTETFMQLYPNKTQQLIAEEFVEGTMINVFYDDVNSHWDFSTKSTVGAHNSFYRGSKTFNKMFVEACEASQLFLDTLDPRYCYSFVLQHPENRIVVPFNKPKLYLVAVYMIYQTETILQVYRIEPNSIFDWSKTGVIFPKKYEWSNYSELIEKYASPNTSYEIVGVVIKNLESGYRCKIRNPIYEEVRQLRGNQSKMQFQYLFLRTSGKIHEFLKFYPEMKSDFSVYRDQVHIFTNTLFRNYISCYIKKEKPLSEFSNQYRTHMFHLHEHYINDLREKKLYITSGEVIRYVNSLAPALLMHSLNYNLNKHNIAKVVSNNSIESV